jgi:hypothetical protein
METTKINSTPTTKLLLLTTTSLCALVFLASIMLHVKPILLINDLADFAVHHYFLTGFIALVMFFVSLKLYFKSTEKYSNSKSAKTINKINRLLKRKERLQQFTKAFSLKIQTVKSHLIDKTQIPTLSFSETDVLNNLNEIRTRAELLITAMKLGNNYKHKVKLFFKDKFNNKHIETTIWHTDSKYVILKGGITLPVNSIYKVEL